MNRSSSSSRGDNHHLLLFLLFLVGICAAAVYTGAVPTRKFGHDIFFLLDNGWRVVTGQRPHLDYTSPWGPLSFLVVAAGLAVSRFSVDAIGYGNAMFAFAVGIWGYRICRDTVPAWARLLLCLYLALLVVSPYSLGWGALNSSHAMFYNRYGYALLGVLMIEALPRGGDLPDGDWLLGGVSTGAVTALCLFLKANYFAAAILLIGASLLWRPFGKRRLAGIAAGFFLVSLAFLAYLQFDAGAILRDLDIAAGARSKSFSYAEVFRKFTLNTLSLLFVLLLTTQSARAKGEGKGTRRLAGVLLGCFVFAVDMLLLCSNQQYSELPLTAIYSLWVVIDLGVWSRNNPGGEARRSSVGVKSTLLIGTVFILVSFFSQLAGLAYGVMQKAHPSGGASVTRFIEPRLKEMLLYDDEAEPHSNGHAYVESVNDGTLLLRQSSAPSEKVLTMDMMNPFPYALGRPAPKGGMAAIAYNYTFSDSHRPSDARFFGDTDIVMVPKQPAAPGRMNAGLMRIYTPALQARFRLAAESNQWYLYRRK
ncbi:hypothetical protein M1B72_12765 [Geomonas paludis]|uniref:Glycosyltransferase RgtA/B/C/D-like domain-containing protein n=1 Tax=Geomonas paludis TaxID=2740185 RepID=A0ABY4L8K9_9BACT|nr:hypothetical protein [Geomonas paludis]UPU34322.1 hypothetical protein M1B72_12765 [Geomonas paludis]